MNLLSSKGTLKTFRKSHNIGYNSFNNKPSTPNRLYSTTKSKSKGNFSEQDRSRMIEALQEKGNIGLNKALNINLVSIEKKKIEMEVSFVLLFKKKLKYVILS
jgi:hypothetical protein